MQPPFVVPIRVARLHWFVTSALGAPRRLGRARVTAHRPARHQVDIVVVVVIVLVVVVVVLLAVAVNVIVTDAPAVVARVARILRQRFERRPSAQVLRGVEVAVVDVVHDELLFETNKKKHTHTEREREKPEHHEDDNIKTW